MSTASKTLPARYYTDPELFRQEMENFYFDGWVCAGRADRIPSAGDYFLREIAGESIIVVRSDAGSVEAFYNVCRHRGTRLCSTAEGSFAGGFNARITAGLTGWMAGCWARPIWIQSVFQRLDYPLHKLHTDLWDGHVFLQCR